MFSPSLLALLYTLGLVATAFDMIFYTSKQLRIHRSDLSQMRREMGDFEFYPAAMRVIILFSIFWPITVAAILLRSFTRTRR